MQRTGHKRNLTQQTEKRRREANIRDGFLRYTSPELRSHTAVTGRLGFLFLAGGRWVVFGHRGAVSRLAQRRSAAAVPGHLTQTSEVVLTGQVE